HDVPMEGGSAATKFQCRGCASRSYGVETIRSVSLSDGGASPIGNVFRFVCGWFARELYCSVADAAPEADQSAWDIAGGDAAGLSGTGPCYGVGVESMRRVSRNGD